MASLGRYFCFCASVPYQTMGSVPMPTCALKATEKLASWRCDSAIMAEVTLSISRPPYSSGMSTAISPSSPAFAQQGPGDGRNSSPQSASAAGSTSFAVNSTAVLAICRCSSEKSSGVKTSCGLAFFDEKAAARLTAFRDAVRRLLPSVRP